MRRIKWENLLLMVMVVLDVAAIGHHIRLNGFYGELFLEVVMYGLLTFGVWTGSYSIRKGL